MLTDGDARLHSAPLVPVSGGQVYSRFYSCRPLYSTLTLSHATVCCRLYTTALQQLYSIQYTVVYSLQQSTPTLCRRRELSYLPTPPRSLPG